ncbi:MAG: 50S ribosomal protein L24 [Acidiferrobacteraceae bacterium]|nr:50S ribosomal protein L24 [Acidiferrobacteraceae bacterium]|tara:strand:+ start:52 stop:378 length:327 start_codon:yes stop_codon:yes gene_type:complete
MTSNRIRQGDDVIVLSGRDRGKRGTVLRVFSNGKALVDNVNVVKKHERPNPNKGQTGGIIEKEAPIHLSNIALYNPNRKRGDRIGSKTLADGRKVRVFRSDNEVVDPS